MTVKEFYLAAGGNYDEVVSRLMNDVIIKKFLLKFENDKSFLQLRQAVADNNARDAFMAAHTLKGVTVSLGLGDLNRAAADITELLREADTADSQEIISTLTVVEEYYKKALALINDVD